MFTTSQLKTFKTTIRQYALILLTLPLNSSEKLLVVPLFLQIHMTMMQTHLMKIPMIHYALVHMTNLLI